MVGTWGLIQSKKINHTVLQNSYFDVFLVLVALSDSCQFVYTKELRKHMQHERQGHVSFRNYQTKLNIFRSQAQLLLMEKVPSGARQSQLTTSRWQQTTLQT